MTMTRKEFIAGVLSGSITKTKGGLCPLCGYPKSPAQRTMVCGGKDCRNVAYEAGYQKMLMDRKGDTPRKGTQCAATKQHMEHSPQPAANDNTNWGDLTPFVAHYDYGQYVYCADPVTGF